MGEVHSVWKWSEISDSIEEYECPDSKNLLNVQYDEILNISNNKTKKKQTMPRLTIMKFQYTKDRERRFYKFS